MCAVHYVVLQDRKMLKDASFYASSIIIIEGKKKVLIVTSLDYCDCC